MSTQIDFHARFGGVVPEIASRKHVEVIVECLDAALEDAAASLGLEDGAIAPSELAAVGVTQGPGLVGALVVGVAFAMGFAYAAGKAARASTIWRGTCFANPAGATRPQTAVYLHACLGWAHHARAREGVGRLRGAR